jgi:hypothetical protein
MSTYRGRKLVIRQGGAVRYDAAEIGTVYPDRADTRVQTRDWRYAHVTGQTLKDLHPDWPWERTGQVALTKRDAARLLADLHLAIGRRENTKVPAGSRRYTWTVRGESHHPHSSPQWRLEEASGVIEVREELADAGDALVTIITGRGEGGTLEATIPWDLFSLAREVSITFGPAGEAESPGA